MASRELDAQNKLQPDHPNDRRYKTQLAALADILIEASEIGNNCSGSILTIAASRKECTAWEDDIAYIFAQHGLVRSIPIQM